MKIYTKTGDEGETSLIYGRRIRKDDLQVETYGTIDEANSVIGTAIAQLRMESVAMGDLLRILVRVQRDLFDLGRDLATPEEKRGEWHVRVEHVAVLEKVIDRLDAEVPPLRQFILPGGALSAAALHHARTVVRRAERLCVRLYGTHEMNSQLRKYLNRLSDLLFVMARVVNLRMNIAEPFVDFSMPPEDVE